MSQVAQLVARLDFEASRFTGGARAAAQSMDAIAANAARTNSATAAVAKALDVSGQTAQLSGRKIQSLAGSLIALSGNAGAASQTLFAIASAAEVAAVGIGRLEKASIILTGIAAVAAATQYIADYVKLGSSVGTYLEKLEAVQNEERARLGVRAQLVQIERAATRATATANAEAGAAALRRAGDEINAIGMVTAARVKAMRLEEEEKLASIRTQSNYPGGQVARDAALKATAQQFAAERVAIEAQALEQITALDKQRLQKLQANEESRSQLFARLATERVDALQGTRAAVLAIEEKLTQVAIVQANQRLGAIRTEGEARIAEARKAVTAGLLSEAEFNKARLGIVESASAKILGVLAQEQQQRKSIIAAGAEIAKSLGIENGIAEGVAAIDAYVKRVRTVTDAYAGVVASGVPLPGVVNEFATAQQALVREYDEMAARFSQSPELFARLNSAAQSVRLGTLATTLEDTQVRLANLRGTAQATQSGLSTFSGAVGSEIPASVGKALPWLDALMGRLAGVEGWFDRATVAARRFEREIDE